MLGFLKKLLGLPTDAEKAAAKSDFAPYKIDAPATTAPVDTKIVSETAVVSAPAAKAPKAKKESKPKAKTENKDTAPKVAKPRAPRKPKVQQ